MHVSACLYSQGNFCFPALQTPYAALPTFYTPLTLVFHAARNL